MSSTSSHEELAGQVAQLRELTAEQSRLIETLRAENAQLRARLGQTPRNSHRPPGSEGYEKPAPKSRRERTGRKSGGQSGHEGRTLSRVECPDEILVHEPVVWGLLRV